MKKITNFFQKPYPCLFLSAFLSALPLTFPSLFLLSWVSLVPFYFVVLSFLKEKGTLRSAVGKGLFFGFTFYSFIYFWFLWLYPLTFAGFDKPSSLVLVLIAWLGISFVHGAFFLIPTLLCHLVSKKVESRFFLLFTAVIGLLIALYIPAFSELAFPWVKFSLGQYRAPVFIQSASLFGATGVDFLMLTFSALLTLFFASEKGRKRTVCLVLALTLFSANLTFGIFSLSRERGEETITVSLVQGNVLSTEKFSGRDFTSLYTDLTEEISDVDLVLWSETAIPMDLSENTALLNEFQSLSAKIDAPILLGCFWGKDEGTCNSAVLITPDFVSQPYAKRHLVPFGEGVPYEDVLLRLFPDLSLLNLSYNTILAGEEATLFSLGEKKLGAIICFESLFPALTRESVKAGADMMVLLTNDSWYEDSPAVYQHLAHGVFRSVETGRATLRCAGSGVSALISEKGEILEELGPLRRGVVTGEVSFCSSTTLYTLIGDILLPVLAVIWLFCLAVLIWKERRHSFVR